MRWPIVARVIVALGLLLGLSALTRTELLDGVYSLLPAKSWTVFGVIALAAGLFAWLWRTVKQAFRMGRGRGYVGEVPGRPIESELAFRRLRRLRIMVVILSVLLTFSAAEITFRVMGIYPPLSPRPQHLDGREVDNRRNVLGLREHWQHLPDDDPRLRIAFLGDSFTYGEGVEKEEAFPHRVGLLLADDRPAGVVTINVGQPGTGPSEHLQKYLGVREEICPDVVVHVIYLNDIGVNLHDFVRRIYQVRDDRLWLGKRSLVLHFGERQVRYWMAWNYTLDYFRGGRTTHERQAAWAYFESEVRKCKRAAEDGGAVYCMVVFPWIYRLRDYPLRDWHRDLHAFVEDLGVPYWDLLKNFEGFDDSLLRISAVNEHPNPAGHALAAAAIARFLREDVLPNLESPR